MEKPIRDPVHAPRILRAYASSCESLWFPFRLWPCHLPLPLAT